MNAWEGILLFVVLLSALLAAFRMLGARMMQRRDSAAAGAPPDEDETLVVVLAAAAAHVLGHRVRLRRIRFLRGTEGSAWAVTGRLNIMASHLVRKGSF